MGFLLLLVSIIVPVVIVAAIIGVQYFTNGDRDITKLTAFFTITVGAGVWLMFFLQNLTGFTLCVVAVMAAFIGVTWFLTNEGSKTIIAVIIVALIGGGIWTYQYFQNFANDRVVTCTVTGKDRGGNKGSYRVYTSCGTFANRDSVIQGKTNSADVQGQIPVNRVVTLHVAGARVSLWSGMPNILGIVKSGK